MAHVHGIQGVVDGRIGETRRNTLEGGETRAINWQQKLNIEINYYPNFF